MPADLLSHVQEKTVSAGTKLVYATAVLTAVAGATAIALQKSGTVDVAGLVAKLFGDPQSPPAAKSPGRSPSAMPDAPANPVAKSTPSDIDAKVQTSAGELAEMRRAIKNPSDESADDVIALNKKKKEHASLLAVQASARGPK